MAIDIEFRPIERWPGVLQVRRGNSPFRTSYSNTLRLLERELLAVGATRVLLQVALPAHKIRRDGLPYQDARPVHPGVILTFESPKGGLSFPCDRFDTWQDNLRAIALALEALRKVDRYGVTRNNEQYRGWAKLPGPGYFAGSEAAKAWLEREAGLQVPITDRETLSAAYKAVARKFHPDAGGDAEEFKRATEARDLVAKSFVR